MKLIFLLIFLAFLQITEAKSPCDEECNDTEYNSYIECIRKRMKRSTDCSNSVNEACENCENNCQQCDCNICAVNVCDENCNNCCPNNPPCTTSRCCHKLCHSQCNSSSCRNECRKTCKSKISRGSNSTVAEKIRHNITTVINLHNTVNNTNVIDIPIEVNNTNLNNITLTAPEETVVQSDDPSSQVNQHPCCFIISPRQCVPIETYPFAKCFHYRRKICDQLCRAPIVHEQPHQICDQTSTGTTCHQQVMYIPQPQPRCAYQPAWPYVSCGAPQQNFCGGCYQHYNSMFPQAPPYGCPWNCYDDGYGQGPYYRQGPFYRPGYSHTPSCYQIGTCGNNAYNYPGGFGGGCGGFPCPPQIAPNFGGFGNYGGIYGTGYPFNSYENNFHIETNPSNVMPSINHTWNATQVMEPPPPGYYPISVYPQYVSSGYPYLPQYPPYNLPPEVDIQAIITQPEKDSRYAQITISKDPSKRQTISDEEQVLESTSKESE